ncbi:MAG: basic amino acid ABC transporter substrate-binding protein [Lachnospiraceae bacterium]|nr:basic amino acid ABC transporter substrate-binding protein [Lachnospiraceae bacterium]
MKKFLAMLLAVVMCVACMTACGGNEAASTGDVLVVGTNAEFPPFEYIGDDGNPDGFDIALIKEIGKKLGMEVKIENMEFGSLVAAIGSKIDASIAGMTITEERLQSVDFSDPYYDAYQYVIVPIDSNIATFDDLKNKNIGCQLGTTGFYIADEDIEGATATGYNKGVDAVNDLINGRVELVIIDKNPAMVFGEKFSDKVKVLDGAQFGFEMEQYAIALPKGSELVGKVNDALKELKADGTFDALVKQYIEGNE